MDKLIYTIGIELDGEEILSYETYNRRIAENVYHAMCYKWSCSKRDLIIVLHRSDEDHPSVFRPGLIEN